MTDEEWLASTDPRPMVEFLADVASDRKLRLLAVACCNRIWEMLPAARKNQNTALESYADGMVTRSEYQAAAQVAYEEADAEDRDLMDVSSFAAASVGISDPPTASSVTVSMDAAATAVAIAAAEKEQESQYDATYDTILTQERRAQIGLVLDIFGNPFRPVTLDRRWLSSTVLDLARTIYDQRTFENMPILADGLMDAGCDSDEIIQHCQGTGPHVRGCWVVDLLLGKV